jgi:hypothetical protein
MITLTTEQTVTLPNGKTFTLSRLSPAALRGWKDWIANRVGDPFELVTHFLGKIPESETLRQLREGEELRDQLKFFSLSCPLARKMIATEEGAAALVLLLLQGKHPNATEDDALEAAIHLAERGQATAPKLAETA